MRSVIASACFMLAAQAVCWGGNWPHWRGPSMNGVSTDRDVPLTWSATDNVAWKLALPDFSARRPSSGTTASS